MPAPDPDTHPPLAGRTRSRKLRLPAAKKPHVPPDHIPGRKRQKASGATYRSLKGPPKRCDIRGSYSVARIAFASDVARIQRKPITEFAKDLLVDFLKRQAFWEAVEGSEFPVGLAGEAYLSVKKRRAEEIRQELAESGDPRRWFVAKALAGIAAGKIAEGRATAACRIADVFFTELAGGETGLDDIEVKAIGGVKRVEFPGCCEGFEGIDLHILSYTICKHL